MRRRKRIRAALTAAVLAVVWLGLVGCATGRGALREGDFTQAARVAAERLAGQPKAKKAGEVFLRAYPLARAEWLSRAEMAVGDLGDPFRWERVYAAYDVLRDLSSRAALTPYAEAPGIVIDYFQKELENARIEAVDARLAAGDTLLELGDRHAAREAYRHFRVANRFAGGRTDIDQRLEAARLAGTLRVGIDPVRVEGHGVNPDRLDAVIARSFEVYPVHGFVEAAPSRAWDEGQAHQYLEVVAGELQLERRDEALEERRVHRILEADDGDGAGREVAATVETRRKALLARCPVWVRLYDVERQRWTLERQLEARVEWSAEWDVTRGDRRATRGLELRWEEPPDPEWGEMAERLSEAVAEEARAALEAHYHRAES